jgi:hypothetical protein
MTTTFQQAVREHQVRCLLGAQAHLSKARASGFDLPADVSCAIQEIMTKIPDLIRRLEEQPELAGLAPSRTNKED